MKICRIPQLYVASLYSTSGKKKANTYKQKSANALRKLQRSVTGKQSYVCAAAITGGNKAASHNNSDVLR